MKLFMELDTKDFNILNLNFINIFLFYLFIMIQFGFEFKNFIYLPLL